MNSNILEDVIQYFREHLKEYGNNVFFYEDAFLRASENNKFLYVYTYS